MIIITFAPCNAKRCFNDIDFCPYSFGAFVRHHWCLIRGTQHSNRTFRLIGAVIDI